MDELVDIDSREEIDIVEAWLRWGIPQIGRWVDYIESRLPELDNDPELFRQGEMVFALTSVLNCMAQVYYGRDGNLAIKDKILPWLDEFVGIPPVEGEALWYGVRNRVIHLGAVNSLGSFKATDGRPTFTRVEPSAMPEYGEPPEAGTFEAWRATEPALGAPFFTGRHVAFATAFILSDGSDEFRGVPSGNELVRVTFFLDELIQLVRVALYRTAHHLQENGDRLHGGLARLHEDVYFMLKAGDPEFPGSSESNEAIIVQSLQVPPGRKR